MKKRAKLKGKNLSAKKYFKDTDVSKVAFDDCTEEFTEVYGEDFLDEDGYLLDDEED